MFQFGNGHIAYVIPARFKRHIKTIFTQRRALWIGFNGPHDVRCVDQHLGLDTGVLCKYEARIPCHHHDPRSAEEGGIGHDLKSQAIALIDPDAGRWERKLKAAFKEIEIPIPGEVYKSGPRKGQPKVRKAKIEEGWSLIDPEHPAYLAYAASDPILTYRLWRVRKPVLEEFKELYWFDWRVAQACDTLQRRALPLDVPYLERLHAQMTRAIDRHRAKAEELGCPDIYSGAKQAEAFLGMGVLLTKRTARTGQFQMTQDVLTGIANGENEQASALAKVILTAKRLDKRRSAYVEQMLKERDEHDRLHPSINSLKARTARMSVSNPALQQLPTKDNEEQ